MLDGDALWSARADVAVMVGEASCHAKSFNGRSKSGALDEGLAARAVD